MSRSEMALLPCVLPTPSQVMTMDSKSTFSEVNIFNFFADDGFSGSCGRFPANGVASLPGLVSRRAWVELLQWYLKLD